MNLKKIVNVFKFPKWTKWEYVNENSCEQIRTRPYDDSISQKRIFHDLSPEEYAAEGSCTRVISCNRCNQTQEVGELHPSYNPKYGGYSEQICSRCGTQLDGFMNC